MPLHVAHVAAQQRMSQDETYEPAFSRHQVEGRAEGRDWVSGGLNSLHERHVNSEHAQTQGPEHAGRGHTWGHTQSSAQDSYEFGSVGGRGESHHCSRSGDPLERGFPEETPEGRSNRSVSTHGSEDLLHVLFRRTWEPPSAAGAVSWVDCNQERRARLTYRTGRPLGRPLGLQWSRLVSLRWVQEQRQLFAEGRLPRARQRYMAILGVLIRLPELCMVAYTPTIVLPHMLVFWYMIRYCTGWNNCYIVLHNCFE